ncbi:hypothetical protein PPBDW_II0102 [Photobacterium kishitanii]|nr:hypothetical protein PPBDW_II0102 [Photobacterium kishitanii]
MITTSKGMGELDSGWNLIKHSISNYLHVSKKLFKIIMILNKRHVDNKKARYPQS